VSELVFPTPEERIGIDEVLGFNETASATLWIAVQQIVEGIRSHQASQHQRAQGRNRAETIRYFKSLDGCFGKIESLLCNGDSETHFVLGSQLGRLLGLCMSNEAFERYLYISPTESSLSGANMGGFPPLMLNLFNRLPSLFPASTSNVTFPDPRITQILNARTSAATLSADELLLNFVRELRACISRFLDIERQNTGGSPGKTYRNYVVTKLIPVYEQIFQKRVTATGPFLELCELVVESIGLDTRGLEQAAARLIAKARPR
jgi:hypothetical protein